MPVDLSRLNDIAILTNVPLQEAGPLPASTIFKYLQGRMNTLSKTRIAVAKFDTQSHWRRRNPVNNNTLYNIALPAFDMTPDLESRMVGSRVHVDASLAWTQPYTFNTYKTKQFSAGMTWRVTTGELITLYYLYWIDGISQSDQRTWQLFW